MEKQYIVDLNEAERVVLVEIAKTLNGSSQKVKRARWFH